MENPVWAGLIASSCAPAATASTSSTRRPTRLGPDEVATRLGELNPLLVAVVVYGHQPSASTQNMPAAGAVAAAVKAVHPELPVLMLGGHVAAMAGRTLDEEACDFVARDEGLHTVVDLIEALRVSREPDLSKIRGLGYRVDGGNVLNDASPLVQELDTQIPGIAWDLLPMNTYRAHNWHCFGHLQREPYAAIYTTLGCPYHCTFCCIQAPFSDGEQAMGLRAGTTATGSGVPRTSSQQIDLLVTRYGVRNIKFADEMFVLHPRHVAGICDAIIERGYDLNIWAYARIDTVKDGMLDQLRRAGFHWLAFGIEAADEGVLADVDKRYKVGQVYDTIRKVQAADINIIGNYIFGLPEDSADTMQRTFDLSLDLNCEFANFYSAMAYPGSPLYQQAQREGWALPSTWAGYSQHAVDTLPLPTRHLSAGEVLRFRDQAFQRYFTDPAYLALVQRKFGDDTVAHLREMTAHKLERKFAAA